MSNDDREEGFVMGDGLDWTSPEYLANIAADELRDALGRHGIGFLNVAGDEDGVVAVAFPTLKDAETMMTLGLEQAGPGTLYDRATGSCVSLTALAHDDDEVSDDQISDCLVNAWSWLIHPHMNRRRMGWHATVEMSSADANALTANLNTLSLGGAV